MSRSGYSDDLDDWGLMWRGAVMSAIRGARGQRLLREMLAALDAMPVKRLLAHSLQSEGEHCALGVLGAARGMDVSALDPCDHESLAKAFGVAIALVREISFQNDFFDYHTTYTRWKHMRQWVESNIKTQKTS